MPGRRTDDAHLTDRSLHAGCRHASSIPEGTQSMRRGLYGETDFRLTALEVRTVSSTNTSPLPVMETVNEPWPVRERGVSGHVQLPSRSSTASRSSSSQRRVPSARQESQPARTTRIVMAFVHGRGRDHRGPIGCRFAQSMRAHDTRAPSSAEASVRDPYGRRAPVRD